MRVAGGHRITDESDDDGATFIELLVSIVLLGIGVIAVLVAATAAVVGARTNDQIATTQEALAEASDFLTDTEPENVAYQSCVAPGVAAAYQSALDAQFGVGSVSVVHVLFQDQTLPAGFQTGCNFGPPQGDRLQKIRLRSTFNGSAREVDVVKRPVDTPTVSTIAAPPLPPYAGGSGQATVSVTPGLP